VLRAAGISVAAVQADGVLHRVRAEGDARGQRSGWYVLHAGTVLAGAYGNWKTGDVQRWREECNGTAMSKAERAQLIADIQRAQRRQQAERCRRQRLAQREAIERWRAASPAAAEHPYLRAKGVSAYGIRQAGNTLLIPMRDGDGHLWGLQTIAPDGIKRFLAGGRKRGLYHSIGRMPSGVLCLAEGYATAASVFEATGYPTAVAFDAGNLEPVACSLRGKYPEANLVICADDDRATEARIGRNPGVAAANRAAAAVNGVVAMPPRSEDGGVLLQVTTRSPSVAASDTEHINAAIAAAQALRRRPTDAPRDHARPASVSNDPVPDDASRADAAAFTSNHSGAHRAVGAPEPRP